MTSKCALDKIAWKVCNNCKYLTDCNKCDECIYQYAIDALRKQIPKKARVGIDRSWGIERRVPVCPECDCFLTPVKFFDIDGNCKSSGTVYCENCGQLVLLDDDYD